MISCRSGGPARRCCSIVSGRIASSFGRKAGMIAVVGGRSVRARPRGFGVFPAAIASINAPKPNMPTAIATASRALARALGYSEVRILMNESTIARIAPSTSASWTATERKKLSRELPTAWSASVTTETDLDVVRPMRPHPKGTFRRTDRNADQAPWRLHGGPNADPFVVRFRPTHVRCDRAGCDGRVGAPERRESVDRKTSKYRYRNQIRDTEYHDVTVARQKERTAHGSHVEAHDEQPVRHRRTVRQVMGREAGGDRSTQDLDEQIEADHYSDSDKCIHQPSSSAVGFERTDRQRDADRREEERAHEIDPERGPTQRCGNMALQFPPDEGFDDLMSAQQQRKRGEGKMILPVIHMAQRIDSDDPDDDATNEICLRRIAHTRRLAGTGVILSTPAVHVPPRDDQSTR